MNIYEYLSTLLSWKGNTQHKHFQTVTYKYNSGFVFQGPVQQFEDSKN